MHSSSVFKSYLPESNHKTEQELKSEEFNRKQIINSSREHYERIEHGFEQAKVSGQFRDYSAQNLRQPAQVEPAATPLPKPSSSELVKESPTTLNQHYRRETGHLRSSSRSPHLGDAPGASHTSIRPTRGEERTIENPSSSYALRNRSRDGSASLERSKSPQCS